MSQPKSVTISHAEYSALLGVVAAHRADSASTPSKVLAHYDAVTNRDPGGRVYYVEAGKVYEGLPNILCNGCPFSVDGSICGYGPRHRFGDKRRKACANATNGHRGNRTLHPVRAVG